MVDGGLLWSGQDSSVTQEKTETRNIEENNKGGGPSLPSNYSSKTNSKER